MMEETNNNEISLDQISPDSEVLEVPETKRKVYTEQGDPEIDSLHRKWKDGDLDIQPDFQRGFVWDVVKASRLIESILLDIPLPVIYLSQEKNDKEYVIDGQQRLTSFFSFIDGAFPNEKEFKLKSLNVFTELNGSSYKDLSKEFQKKIRFYKIRTITFRKESEQDLKFEVFERLNTGSVSLNDQELRNCIYRGNYNDLLWDLSEDKTFRELLGINKAEPRMKDVELVLRFASFYHSTYMNYKPPIKKFLNSEMEKYRFINEKDANELRNSFKNTVTIIKSLLGEHAFKRFYRGDEKQQNGYWEKQKFNASLYDILMDTFARTNKNNVYKNLDLIREAYIDLMTSDQQFIDAIELSTSSTQAIKMRFEKFRSALDSIFNITHKEPRCFSHSLKELLFSSNPTCNICNQKIISIDDSALDHIEQYWTGGKTIPDNARLTHRYCNNSRSRNDVVPTFGINSKISSQSRTQMDYDGTIIKDREEIKNPVDVLDNYKVEYVTSKGIAENNSSFYLYDKLSLCRNNLSFVNKRVESILQNIVTDEKYLGYQPKWKSYFIETGLDEMRMGIFKVIPNSNASDYSIRISCYFGDTMNQSKSFYKRNIPYQKFEDMVKKGWNFRPDFHVSFMSKHLIWFPTSSSRYEKYYEYWSIHQDEIKQYAKEDFLKFHHKIVELAIIDDAEEENALYNKLINTKRNIVYVCPAVCLSMDVKADILVELDEVGKLENHLKEIFIEGLHLIEEIPKTIKIS